MTVPTDRAGNSDPPFVDDEVHRRPDGVSDATVAAVGKLTEALEWLERAGAACTTSTRMLGHRDFQMSHAGQMLRSAGHAESGDLVDREVVGRNVLDGRWTSQVVEEFESIYYDPICAIEKQVRDALMAGRRHVYEAEMKVQRRTSGVPAHEPRPPAAHDPLVSTQAMRR